MNDKQIPQFWGVINNPEFVGWSRHDANPNQYYYIKDEAWRVGIVKHEEKWLYFNQSRSPLVHMEGVSSLEEAMAVALATWRMG
jgi:hypothetical protein